MGRLLVTIGRQYGSGGREIGRRLAAKLSVPFYGKEELMEIAKGRPDYQEVRAFYEEQPVDSLLYAIAANQMEGQMGKIPFQRIQSLCQEQSCVLVGRCGSYIFREDKDCVRVFIYAGMKEKIKWLTSREGLSESRASRKIQEIEEERARFHRYYTGERWGAVNQYDLCLDSGVLGAEKTVDVIYMYLEKRGLIKHE